jgi:hypothetical protein
MDTAGVDEERSVAMKCREQLAANEQLLMKLVEYDRLIVDLHRRNRTLTVRVVELQRRIDFQEIERYW